MTSDAKPLRDFLYLDMERVRSFVAQLYEGVPESSTAESGSDSSIHGKVEGAVPLLLKGQAGADYRFFRSRDETRSFHHYVYTLFEKELRERGQLKTVNAKYAEDSWAPDAFADGELVVITGDIRIADYKLTVDTIREMPRLVGLVNRLSDVAVEHTGKGKRGGQPQRVDLGGISTNDLKNLSEFIERGYGEAVRVKVRPSDKEPQNVFSSTALRANFQDGVPAVLQNHGLDLVGSWRLVGQVNQAQPPIDVNAVQYSPFSTGNPVEDGLDQLVYGFDILRRALSGVKYPCFSLNLISIYRDCR